MATIILEYDGRNTVARKMIDLLRSLDVFTITEPKKKKTTLMSKEDYFAMLDRSKAQAERGEVYRFDDKQKMMDWLYTL